jgi:hypothetical protein
MQTVYSADRQWRFTSKGWQPANPRRPRFGPNTKGVESLFHGVLMLPEQELLKIARLAGDRFWRPRAEEAVLDAIDRAEREGMQYELVGAIEVAGSVGEAVTARHAISPAPSSASVRQPASSLVPVSLAILAATVALVTRDLLTDDEFDLLYRPMMPVKEASRRSDGSERGPSEHWVG